jgi:hypothetical protein
MIAPSVGVFFNTPSAKKSRQGLDDLLTHALAAPLPDIADWMSGRGVDGLNVMTWLRQSERS